MSLLRGGAVTAIILGFVVLCAEYVHVTVKEMMGPLGE